MANETETVHSECPMCKETNPNSAAECAFCGYVLDAALRARKARMHRTARLVGAGPEEPPTQASDRVVYGLLVLGWPLVLVSTALGWLFLLFVGARIGLCLLAGQRRRAMEYTLAVVVGLGAALVCFVALYAG